MELPRHVHKRGGVGQGGESKVVSTETELDAAVADGWVVDPNAAASFLVSAEEGARADRAASEFLTLPVFEVSDPEALPILVDESPIPDVLDDPDGAPPAELTDGDATRLLHMVDEATDSPDVAEPAKRRPGRPRRS